MISPKSCQIWHNVPLHNNQFNGCLPYQLGFVGPGVTARYQQKSAYRSGPLPFSFGCLENAEVLNFAQNLLYGMLPDLVCQLQNLVNLTLLNNYFTGLGNTCRTLIKSRVLDGRKHYIR
ncbi:hypothetical protein Dimus_004536 [Dionaea muscipula]